MAAHWSNEMVTVFTAVAYYRNEEGNLDYNSYAVISDEASHDKANVYTFNKAVLDIVRRPPLWRRFTTGVMGQAHRLRIVTS